MQAIITAGGTFSADNPLFIETGIAKKALLPMGDKLMIQWVAEALMQSKHITGLVIVGMEAGEFDDSNLNVQYTPSLGNIIDNVKVGIELAEKADPHFQKAIICSSDVPLINADLIDEFIDICLETDHDLYYPVVEEQTLEKRFPNSMRTFTPMKGGRYTGGDVMMVDKRAVKINLELMRGLTGQRKNFFQQARMIGFTFIFRFIFHLMDIEEAGERASKTLNIKGRILDYPRAEIGMDVDKLHQYQMVKADIEASQA